MSVFEELKKENLLQYALQGARAVLEQQLGLKDLVITTSETYKQELVRRAGSKENIRYPLNYLAFNAISGLKDRQNNVAMSKIGVTVTDPSRSMAKKAYVFPITVGLELHYIDSDPMKLIWMAQMLAILSVTSGCKFVIYVGYIFEYHVFLEVPTDTSIPIQEEQSNTTPGASELVANLIMHTQVGFFRDVASLNGKPLSMVIDVEGGGSVEVKL